MIPPWDRSWIRRAIVLVVTLKVVGLVLVVDWTGRTTNPFDLTKSLYSRSLGWVLASLVVIAVVGWGMTVFPRTRLHLLVAAILVSDGVATFLAPEPYVAIYGTQGRYLGLVFAIDMAVLYIAVAAAFRKRVDWLVLGGALVSSVVLSLVYAWVQYAGLDPLPWAMSGRARPFSTIGNPNTYGHLLSVALPATGAIGVAYRGPRGWLVRILTGLLAAAIVIVDGIVATRGTFLGLIAAAIVVPILFLYSRRVNRSMLARLSIGLAAATLFTIAVLSC